MSEIRVTYSGLISFIVGIASIFTGLIFTLIVTRKLTPEEFGTWGLIGALISYVLVTGSIINYWSTREIARGENSGKTALISSSLFSGFAVILYLILTTLFGKEIVDHNVLIFAAILVPVEFIKIQLKAINLGYKPQNVEYGLAIFEVVKIVAAVVVIIFLDMGILGAIIATTLGSVASVVVLSVRARKKLKDKINVNYLKKWFRLSWLPLYPKISGILGNIDVVIFTIMTGSVVGLAYWGVSKSISNITGHAAKINKAIYPKLLSGGKRRYLQENITRVFYFALPLAAMGISFSKPGLFALNPLYQNAVPIILVLVPLIFLRNFTHIFVQSLSGIEKVDTNEKATLRDYLRSKLFYLPTLNLIQRSIYIISLILVLYFIMFQNSSEIDLVLYWSMVALGTELPYTLFLYFLVKKEFDLKFNVKTIFKYLLVTIFVFGITYLLMNKFLIYENKILEFLPNLLPFVIFAIISYLGLTYLIDSRTQLLFKSIFKEIKNFK